MKSLPLLITGFVLLQPVLAQVPDAPAPPGQPPAAGGGAPASATAKPVSPLGNEIPVLDPTTEIMQFNGKSFSVSNNRIFQARFEKYLNAPEASGKEDKDYRALIDRILQLLAPGSATPQTVDAAFKVLPHAGRFDIDARLCDSLADAVYSVWQAQRNQARLTSANAALEEARKTHEWNLQSVTDDVKIKAPPRPSAAGGAAPPAEPAGGNVAGVANNQDFKAQPYATRLAETMASIKANQIKRELSEVQAKVEFQGMMVQFFLQRRFQHVLISTRFYRALFTDGDTKLNLGKDATDLFKRGTGMPPTVSVIDSLANEAMRDVREGVKAFEFLLEKNEMQGATMRLQEAFVVGEYMPEIRLIPRDKKRQCQDFAQKSYQLISAIEVLDYGRAGELVADLKKVANDFDDSKPMAAIEGARVQARAYLAKAKQAALANDQVKFEEALTAAARVWPRNPDLKDVSEKLFDQGDVMQKTLLDFDQLLSQKNYRLIWEDKFRFGAAVGFSPERKVKMEKVMANMELIERALADATVRGQQNDYPGAWETLEKAFEDFPEDQNLNQQRADMTTKASDFVRAIKDAEEMERREQTGASLALFLKAQKIYPASKFARNGIDRLKIIVLPEAQP